MTGSPHRWEYVPGQELSLHIDGLVLARYHFATDRRKPFIDPLRTSSGVLLTAMEPWDHVWHKGLWFSWRYLNGVDYWEEGRGDDLGRMELAADEQVELLGTRATIKATYRYFPLEAATVMNEVRVVALEIPQSASDYWVDWTHTFVAADGPVVIDRTPITDETPWGGYAGLSWRAARSLGNFRALDSEGRRDREIQHQRARWVDLSGASDGGADLAAGIAIFDHPGNERHPAPWLCILDPGFGCTNPAFVLAEPYTLESGAALTLRYRVVVHDGFGDRGTLEEEFMRFAAS